MFNEEQDGTSGDFPEFGAIFMSNRVTRKECFRRKLLGLPSGQAPFVKRVKAGMILFLFEFERRELHGVFQAGCDGAMNIVPHAFNSSGKRFPAQVKFTTIWWCSPLSENEFREAIRENYFSANKFNFGLSERQVKRLLLLFSSKKLKVEQRQRQHIQTEVAGSIKYSMCQVISAVNDEHFVSLSSAKADLEEHRDGDFRPSSRNACGIGSFVEMESKKKENNGHGSFEPVNAGECFRESFGCQQREIIDGSLGNECEMEGDCELLPSKNHGGNGRLDLDDCLRPVKSFYPSNSEVPGLNNSLSPSLYDPGIARPVYYTSSRGLINSSLERLERPSLHDSESTPRYQAPEGMGIYAEYKSGPYSDVPFLCPGHNDHSCAAGSGAYFDAVSGNSRDGGTFGFSFPKPSLASVHSVRLGNYEQPQMGSYSTSPNVASPYSFYRFPVPSQDKNDQKIHLLERNEASAGYDPLLSAHRTRSLGMGYEETMTSPYSFYRFPVTSQDRNDQKIHLLERNEASAGYDPLLSDHGTRSLGMGYGETITMDPEIIQGSQNLYSNHQKSRESVFSRLALPSEAIGKDNVADIEDADVSIGSVNDVMAMLHRNQTRWTQGKYFNQSTKRHEDGVSLGKKKRTADSAKHSKDLPTKTSKEIGITGPPATEEGDVQVPAWTPFMDFKRRSKVQKSEHYGSTKHNEEITKNDGFSVGKHKRRRLIRPKFCQNEVCSSIAVGSKGTDTNRSQDGKLPFSVGQEEKNVDLVSSSCSRAEEDVESLLSSCRKGDNDDEELSKNICKEKVLFSVSCRVEGNDSKTLQNAEHLRFQINDGKKSETERGFSGEAKELADVGRVEASKNVGVQPMPAHLALKDKSLFAEEGSGHKNAQADGVLQHHICESCPVLHGTSLAMHGEAAKTGLELGTSFRGGIANVSSAINKC